MPCQLKKITARALLALICLILPAGCVSTGNSYQFKNIAKTDIDMVADTHLRQVNSLLRELTVKLYKRNPAELTKKPGQTIETRLSQLFDRPGDLRFAELDKQHDIKAILLAFDPEFSGDRVFALMAGLCGMISQSYNFQDEFFLLDRLDGQKLYNSARNIEILVWRLSNKRDQAGRLFLLTNGEENGVANLSFERLFGKMIALQDMLATIIADRNNRTINTVVHGIATAAFIPIGL